MKRLVAAALGSALGVSLLSSPAVAQSSSRPSAPTSRRVVPPAVRPPPSAAATPTPPPRGSAHEQVASVLRAAHAGGQQAIQLAEQLSAGELTPIERLVAVRALASNPSPKVQRALLQAVSGDPSDDDLRGLAALSRRTAAMALGAARSPEGTRALSMLLRQEGDAGEAARAALLAHPPTDLKPFTGGGHLSSHYVALLAELGDQRAFHPLREVVRRDAGELGASAALALTRLGAFETEALARRWLVDDLSTASPSERARHLAAARILTQAKSKAYPKIVGQLLASDEWALGVELARTAPHPKLVPALLALLERVQGEPRLSALAALGAAGGERAITWLIAALTSDDQAAAGLALAHHPGAESALLTALQDEPRAHVASRALGLRHAARHRTSSAARAAWLAQLSSKDPVARAAAAFGLALRDDAEAVALIRRDDAPVVIAAARTALGRPALLLACAERLAEEQDPRVATALAIGLTAPAAAERVPTLVLLRLVHQGGAARYLAAYVLSQRDTALLRPEIAGWLSSGDPELRRSAALGLGLAAHPSAVGRLDAAYRFEVDPGVRHALVLAMGSRPEPTREHLLHTAAMLDPEPDVYRAARLLKAQPGAPQLSGPAMTWLELRGGRGGLVVLTRTTPALPLVPDPDGHCPVAGLPGGELEVLAIPDAEP